MKNHTEYLIQTYNTRIQLISSYINIIHTITLIFQNTDC